MAPSSRAVQIQCSAHTTFQTLLVTRLPPLLPLLSNKSPLFNGTATATHTHEQRQSYGMYNTDTPLIPWPQIMTDDVLRTCSTLHTTIRHATAEGEKAFRRRPDCGGGGGGWSKEHRLIPASGCVCNKFTRGRRRRKGGTSHHHHQAFKGQEQVTAV